MPSLEVARPLHSNAVSLHRCARHMRYYNINEDCYVARTYRGSCCLSVYERAISGGGASSSDGHHQADERRP